MSEFYVNVHTVLISTPISSRPSSSPEHEEEKCSKEDLNLGKVDVDLNDNPCIIIPSRIEGDQDSDDDVQERDVANSTSISCSAPNSSSTSGVETTEECFSDVSSDGWETDDEVFHLDERISKIKARLQEKDEDVFGYIPLRTKVLRSILILNGKPERRRKRVTWKDGGGGSCTSKFRKLWEQGGDLSDLPLPLPLCEYYEDDDPLCGLRSIGEILHDSKLTISQKYRSLGIEEDQLGFFLRSSDEEEQDQGPCSCWVWLKYKIAQIYNAQWPLHHLPPDQNKKKVDPIPATP